MEQPVALTRCLEAVLFPQGSAEMKSKPAPVQNISSRYIAFMPPTGNVCYFLDTLPIELRNEIYKLLLVNPLLGSAAGVMESPKGVVPRYYLHPAILRTCRQVSEEASSVLYGYNEFYIMSTSRTSVMGLRSRASQTTLSPLTRFRQIPSSRSLKQTKQVEVYNKVQQVKRVKALKKVQRWKAELDTTGLVFGNGWTPLWFYEFCLTISQSSCHSLDIRLVRTLLEDGEGETPKIDDADAMQLFRCFLIPLRLLRNIRNLRFTDSITDHIHVKSPLPEENLVWELFDLTSGNSPLRPTAKVYTSVLRYARSFERCANCKDQMDHTWDNWLLKYQDYRPFVKSDLVVRALWRIKQALYSDCEQEFQSYRAIVLQLLEGDYKRIEKASLEMRSFVKDNKRAGQVFGTESTATPVVSSASREALEHLLHLLHQYAVAFNRTILRGQWQIVTWDCIDIPTNDTLPRQKLFIELQSLLKSPNSSYLRIIRIVKLLIDDMDTQYLEIRAARKELFAWDALEDRMCDIDVEEWRQDEMVDWRVNEPLETV